MAASDNESSPEDYEMGNRHTIGQSREWLVEALEPPDDIGQTGGNPKVLLLQMQLLTD